MHTLEVREHPLVLENIEAGYGQSLVLHGVSLAVPRGQIVTLIGANGAGKSTVLKVVFGVLRPTRGRIWLDGADITTTSSRDRIRLGVAYCPQGRCNFPRMTVRENLEMGAYLIRKANTTKERLHEMLNLFPVLRKKEREYAGNLSGGQQQVLEMAVALIMKPKLLLIDEPSIGLSPIMTQEVFEYVKHINHDGVTVFMVEQNARRALAISDVGIVLQLGRLWIEQPAEDMLNNEEVRRHYLGTKSTLPRPLRQRVTENDSSETSEPGGQR